MSEVVDLKRPEPRIWVCGCGCCSFELLEDGTSQCSLCGDQTERGSWYVEKPDAAETAESPIRDVNGNGSVSFAKHRLRSLATQDDARMMVIALDGGSVSVWADYVTDDQRAWMLERLEIAADIIKKQQVR